MGTRTTAGRRIQTQMMQPRTPSRVAELLLPVGVAPGLPMRAVTERLLGAGVATRPRGVGVAPRLLGMRVATRLPGVGQAARPPTVEVTTQLLAVAVAYCLLGVGKAMPVLGMRVAALLLMKVGLLLLTLTRAARERVLQVWLHNGPVAARVQCVGTVSWRPNMMALAWGLLHQPADKALLVRGILLVVRLVAPPQLVLPPPFRRQRNLPLLLLRRLFTSMVP